MAEEALATIQKLLDKFHTDRHDEARILELLEKASTDDLNMILNEIDVSVLISSIDDRTFGPKNRQALLELLTVKRLKEITLENRFALVDALQRRSRGSKELQHVVKNIFLGTEGPELTRLKNLVDSNYDHYDMQLLLWDFVSDPAVRLQLLEHIAAAALDASSTGKREIKLLSDIDDTLYCNLFDKRYPKGTTYPGVIELYRELDIGPQEDGHIGDIVFVTARPEVVGGIVERQTKKAIRERGIELHTVLTGSFLHLVGERIAERKFENFLQFAQIYPEYDYVFFGDSGQADALFGMRMLEADKRMKAVLIHEVVPVAPTVRRTFTAAGVRYFHTHAAAARIVFELGLISRAGLQRVLAAMEQQMPRSGASPALLELYREDVRAAQEVLARTEGESSTAAVAAAAAESAAAAPSA